MPSVVATLPEPAPCSLSLLDTDIVSLSHKRRLGGSVATRLIGRRPLITFVTFGELAKWTDLRDWGSRRRQELADWLSGIPVLPGDEAVAATWGILSASATLFGLGFDTATEVGILALAGGAAAFDLPFHSILVLSILFAAGMCLMDTSLRGRERRST